jgi:Na+-transporting NADH:ubiquinone oxidoreductase subunit NqrD
MNQEELVRAIQRVGMGTFVKYYEALADDSKESDSLVDGLMNIEGYGEGSAITKVSSARRIIKLGLAKEALEIISNSQNTESWVAPKASFLLGNYEK